MSRSFDVTGEDSLESFGGSSNCMAVRCIFVACRTLLVITGLQRSRAIPDGLALTSSALGSSLATEAKGVGLGGFLNEKAFPAHSLWTINRRWWMKSSRWDHTLRLACCLSGIPS